MLSARFPMNSSHGHTLSIARVKTRQFLPKTGKFGIKVLQDAACRTTVCWANEAKPVAPCVTGFKTHAQGRVQCRHLVLGLRALLLAAQRYAGGDVLDAHGRLHLVDILAACPAGPQGLNLEVRLGDVYPSCFVTCKSSMTLLQRLLAQACALGIKQRGTEWAALVFIKCKACKEGACQAQLVARHEG